MPWYHEFFDEDYVRFWLLGGEREIQRAPGEVDFIEQALELQPGATILDLCCGQGRHSVLLAQRGYEVTGQDLSPCLLDLARRAAEEAGVNVEWVESDMRELNSTDRFDAVINMFTAFGYLESEQEELKVLRGVRRALRPGGRFLLDLPNRACMREAIADGQREWREHEGHFLLDEHHRDDENRRILLRRLILDPQGDRREKSHSLRQFTPEEIVDLLGRAGLEHEKSYADINYSPLQPKSRRMLVIARKPGS
jgi:SAM-dependent methyltransferase